MENKNNQSDKTKDKEFLEGSISSAKEVLEANGIILDLMKEQSSNTEKMLEIAKDKSDFRETDIGYVAEYAFDKEYQKLAHRSNRIQMELNKVKQIGELIPSLTMFIETEKSRVDSMEKELEEINNPKEEKKDE